VKYLYFVVRNNVKWWFTMKKICMVIQDSMVKGGIAAVVSGYRGSNLENEYKMIYVESYKDGGKLTKLIKVINGLIHFIKVLLVDKPELVHIHSSFGPSFYRKMFFIYLATWAQTPIINHIHGADFENFYLNASKKKRDLIEKIYNKCTMLIALSDQWKENLKEIVPIDKIAVIENYSVLHKDVVLDRANRSLKNQILFLGEIGRRKGCYDIPKVVSKVADVIPDVKFVIGGSGEIDKITKKLKEYRVDKNVTFTGWVRGKDKETVLRESDIFFLPSYNEGMPMSILDAMGYGLPIVSTNVGGIPNIVHNGKNGFVCNAGDIEAFSKGIINILLNEKKCKNFGRRSYELIEQKYSLEKHCSVLASLYKSIIT
jgi:glycosyltransferase involved in cell wall biosynthesis